MFNTLKVKEMKNTKVKLLLAALVLTVSFGYSQDATNSKTQTDSTAIPAKNFTTPLIYVGNTGKEGGSISKDVILKNSFLTAKKTNDSVEWKILSYTVTFASNGKEDVPITVTGAQFSEKVKTRIQSASSGTIIEISNVLIQSVVGTSLIVRPIVIRIR